MTTSIRRPSSVLYNGSGSTWVTTQGSAPANTPESVLADENDDSYITDAGTGGAHDGSIALQFPTLALPSLSEYKSIRVRVRARRTAGGNALQVDLYKANGDLIGTDTFVLTTGAVTYTGTTRTTPVLSDDEVDGVYAVLHGSSSVFRVFALYLDTVYNEAPVANATAPADPVTATSKPTVVWSYSDAEGDGEQAYEIVVFEAADYGDAQFDASSEGFYGSGSYYSPTLRGYSEPPGSPTHIPAWRSGDAGASTGAVLSAATSAQILNALENGKTYRAYVRAADAGGSGIRWGPRDYQQFTLSFTPPAPPALAVHPDDANARMIVEITSAGGAPSTEFFVVERSLDGGATWATVDDNVPNPASGTTTVTIYDYYAPWELGLLYRARSVDTGTNPPEELASDWTTSGAVVLPGGCDTWLKSSSDPSLNRPFTTAPMQESTLRSSGAVFEAQGRTFPIVHLGTQHGEVFSGVVFSLPDDATYDALIALWALRETLLIQFPYGDADGYEQHWVRLPSDLGKVRLSVSGMHDAQPRRLAVPMVEVAEP